MPPPFTFEFRLSAQELSRAIQTAADLPSGQALAGDAKSQLRRTMGWAALYGFFTPIGALAVLNMIFGGISHVFMICAGLASAGAMVYPYAMSLTRRGLRKAVAASLEQSCAELQVPGIIGPVTVTMNESGVQYDAIGTSVWVAWAGMTDVRETDEFIILESIQRRMFVLPIAAVSEVAPPAEVAAHARGCIEASGGRATLIELYMEDETMACPVCEYRIGPGRVSRCPECGREIELADLAS